MKVQGQAQSHPDAMRQGTWGSVCSVCSGLRTGLNERHCKIQRNKMQQTNSTKPRYQLDAKRSNEEKSQDATSNTATHETQQDEMICNKPTVHGDIGHNHGPINMTYKTAPITRAPARPPPPRGRGWARSHAGGWRGQARSPVCYYSSRRVGDAELGTP